MVVLKPGPSALITAGDRHCGDRAENDAARNKRSGSMTSVPPADRRSAPAFSSDMSATATGGHSVPRPA